MAKNTLILDGAFEVLGIKPGPVGYKGGTVDLSRIDAEKAEKLITQNFPYLRKVKAKTARKQKVAPDKKS